MKLKSIIAILLALSLLFVGGCSDEEEDKEKTEECIIESENFSVTEDMALYMMSYTMMMYESEFSSVNVDYSKPLSEQKMESGESYADFLYEKTLESIENILIYCEAALKDEYVVDEGMVYKANENITYLGTTANELGLSTEEYITALFGEGVTIAGLEACTQMMTLCEGYEIQLKDSFEISDKELTEYAEKHKSEFMKFDALRFTTTSKVFADKLAATTNSAEYMSVMSGVSGIDLTDSDQNKIPDLLEITDATVAGDVSGEFASRDDAAPGDVSVRENKDGSYTVTMLLSTPKLDESLAYDFRMVCITSESSADPYSDAASLRDQWIEKKGGEKDFANIAARYSDHPTAYYGGRLSGVTKDNMPSEGVASWVSADSRKKGDTTMAPGDEDSAYILYYIDGNIPLWKFEAKDSLKFDLAKEKVDGMEEEIRKGFKFNEEFMKKTLEKYEKQLVIAQTANLVTD